MTRVLVTGSSGHLGEAIVRLAETRGIDAVGIDVLPGSSTHVVGSIVDSAVVAEAITGADAVIHAATLHKPHVSSHDWQAFIDVNVTGTRTLLDAAIDAGVARFVFTSSTSAFGDALVSSDGRATWITEAVTPRAKNIYGATKLAAEALCELAYRERGLDVTVLRTSRFFPEADDDPRRADAYADQNLKVLELASRRVDLADAADAHLLAATRVGAPRSAMYVISAPTPFDPGDAELLGRDAAAAFAQRCPRAPQVFADLGWRLPEQIDRVYDASLAVEELRWRPAHTFSAAVEALAEGGSPWSALTDEVGSKGYHRPA